MSRKLGTLFLPAEALLITILCFGHAMVYKAAQGAVFLGIVEASPEHYFGETPQTPYMVRAAFVWKNGIWKAFPCRVSNLEDLRHEVPNFPERVSWTIAFHGKDLGGFTTTRPSAWEFYGDLGLLQPNPSAHVNLVRDGASDFVYWGRDPLPFRPMVVVSRPNFFDPDHWKPESTPPEVVRRVIPSFRSAVPSAQLSCRGKATAQFSDELILPREGFVSGGGIRLVQLALDNSAVRHCEALPSEAFSTRWFYVDDNKVRPVGRSLELIDAGDYDNDGRSEVVFHKSGYNYDGYLLLYDGLQREVKFEWNYH